MNAQIDFGYPLWLSYGHLVILAPALLLLLLAYARRWSRGPVLLLSAVVLWSAASFVIARFVFNLNGRASLPVQSFLRSGTGRVLDMGAGTGRSSIMVLEARPQAELVALDLFAKSFRDHFGPGGGPQEKLLANLKAAGVDRRTTIQTGDMRKLPFEPAEFDGIVSSYAIDHLTRDGVNQALGEAARVLKPGGEFLLMLVGKDGWLQFTFGPLLLHGGLRGPEWWNSRLAEAGFQVLEQGRRPMTLYFLARKAEGAHAAR
jgi:SAM-dependent methyltransferase